MNPQVSKRDPRYVELYHSRKMQYRRPYDEIDSSSTNSWFSPLRHAFKFLLHRNQRETVRLYEEDDGIEVESVIGRPSDRSHFPHKKHDSADIDLVTVKSMPRVSPITSSPSTVNTDSSDGSKYHHPNDNTEIDLVTVMSMPRRTSRISSTRQSQRSMDRDNDFADIDLVTVKSMPKRQFIQSSRSTSASYPRVRFDDNTCKQKSSSQPMTYSGSSYTPSTTTSHRRRKTKNCVAPHDIDIDAFHSSLGIGVVSVTSFKRQ